jgi:processive 1,2-diacylglycerol beta-glucosyltransferase
MKIESKKRYRVVFPFVEAGLGHIMPLKAVADAFEKKYGGEVEVIRTDFFKDKNNAEQIEVEKEFVKEVKLHNKNRLRGFVQFLLMRIFGSRLSLKYLMEKRYKKGFLPSLEYIKELDADLIFNTHFSTLYYSCEARKKGLSKAVIMAYCPDPIIGRQWDNRADFIGVSSNAGIKKAVSAFRFDKNQLGYAPFLIRDNVKTMQYGRSYYKKELGLQTDKFTVLLSDGAYGAAKLKQMVYWLSKSEKQMTVIAVCGKNKELYKELKQLKPCSNITLIIYGFTDNMLELSAACDVFAGKAGASSLAEPSYFGAPSIVTFCATPIEKWICRHYVRHVGCAVKAGSVKKAVKLIEKWADNPSLMDRYIKASAAEHRADGPEILADKIWEYLSKEDKKALDRSDSIFEGKFEKMGYASKNRR